MTAKEKVAIPPQIMPEQDPNVRRHNMNEVALGYTADQARLEASRCLQCPNAPCISGCPVSINIPAFLKEAAQGNFPAALSIIRESSLLPAVCGRVCPQEKQCQKSCTMGKLSSPISIGRIERFCADTVGSVAPHTPQQGAELPAPAICGSGICNANSTSADMGCKGPLPLAGGAGAKPSQQRVAIVGAGPAGITVAADCARNGYEVVVYEAFHKAGGVLVYGIPEFRLPKSIVEREVKNLETMGVKVCTNVVVGRTVTVEELLNEFDAVFIGTGAGLPKFMGIEGENLVGVFSANEYLTRANLMKAYDEEHAATPYWHGKEIVVLGGGNVAMDAARMALRLGAEHVRLVYRRSEAEMPARAEEVHHAKEEGVEFHLLENVKRILNDGNGHVGGVECLRYELGEPDVSGRRSPVAIAGSEFIMPADTVIVAVGNGSNPLIAQTTPGLATNPRGNIIADAATGATSRAGVFAGGDIVLGAATVILAMGEGRRAAKAIDEYLKNKRSN